MGNPDSVMEALPQGENAKVLQTPSCTFDSLHSAHPSVHVKGICGVVSIIFRSCACSMPRYQQLTLINRELANEVTFPLGL